MAFRDALMRRIGIGKKKSPTGHKDRSGRADPPKRDWVGEEQTRENADIERRQRAGLGPAQPGFKINPKSKIDTRQIDDRRGRKSPPSASIPPRRAALERRQKARQQSTRRKP